MSDIVEFTLENGAKVAVSPARPRGGSTPIGLGERMETAEKTLRQFGQGARLDAFQLTLNRAAESAVPQVADIFGNAVRQMSVADARAILDGQQDAATRYFERTATPALRAISTLQCGVGWVSGAPGVRISAAKPDQSTLRRSAVTKPAFAASANRSTPSSPAITSAPPAFSA